MASILLSTIGCSTKKKTPLRFGINPWPGYEFIHLAEQKGFFEKNEVSVQILEYASLNDNRLGYHRGQIDGMACTPVEMLQVLEESDRKPVLVFPTDYSNGGDMILAADFLHSIKDLAHKRIASEPGLNMFLLSRALEKSGMTLDSVIIIPLLQTEMPVKWKDNAFEAAVAYPPISVALQAGGMHPVFSSRDIPAEILDILVFDQTILEQRPQDVHAFLRAIEEPQAYRVDHKQESDSIMALHMVITPQEFTDLLEKDIHVFEPSERKKILAEGGAAQQNLVNIHRTFFKGRSATSPFSASHSIRNDFIP